MNLDLDLSVFSRFFRGIVTELRQKRLWPLAVLLVVALVAVPFLLSKSSTPAPPQAQVPTSPPPTGTSIPTLNVETTPSRSHLTGASRNPFGTGSTSTATTASSPASTATAVSTAVSTATNNAVSNLTGGNSGGSSALPTVSTSGSAGSSTPFPAPVPGPTTTPPARSKPAVTGLSPDQAYNVSLAVTNASGGLNTVHSLTRLSALPSNKQPLLVELGVQKGGHDVLFAVEPGAIVSGGGSCTPGPIDCEILSLAPNHTESIATDTASGTPAVVALFEVSGISKRTYGSRSAAAKARQAHSATGQAVLAKSSLPALSLFRYETGRGAVVDLRDLSAGR